LRQIINRHISLLDEAPHLRVLFADAILLMFTSYKDETNREILPSGEVLKLLELIETIEVSEKKPELYGRFSKELISHLDDQSFVAFSKKVCFWNCRYSLNTKFRHWTKSRGSTIG
jgi:hypothetical protein